MTDYVDPNDPEVLRILAQESDAVRAKDLQLNTEIVAKSALDLRKQIESLWDAGLPPGERTGWPSVDKHYTVAPGQLTVVTGWPGSGKSEWVDALVLNLCVAGWRFAVFSPENMPPEIHAVKFLEKYSGKPFGDGPTERMSKDEAIKAAKSIEEWIGFLLPIDATDRLTFGVEEILAAAEARFRAIDAWHDTYCKKGLVIDPWNELEHLRPKQMMETEYISLTLTKVRGWARKHRIHVWIVAHPQKLKREEGKLPIPTPDSISGSQNWWNKADCAITIWRDLAQGDSTVKIYVQKVRFKHIGRSGVVDLEYDKVTGQYKDAYISVVSTPNFDKRHRV